MRKRNSYSRIIQEVATWTKGHNTAEKGKMIHLLHACVETNVTSFDSTDFSGNQANLDFGTALSESGLSRDKIQLIAKVKKTEDPTSAVDELLRSLRTDYLDLLLVEFPEEPGEFRNIIDKLSSQGKILEIGGIDLQQTEMESMKKIVPLRANQQSLRSLYSQGSSQDINSSPASEEILQMVFFDHQHFEQKVNKNGILQELSTKYEVENSLLILSWMLQHPGYLYPVVPFSEEEEIRRHAAAKAIHLDADDWQKLNLLVTTKK